MALRAAFPSFSTSFSFSTPEWAYDVFLSFRGEDVRQNFISHLYDALCRKGIHTYIDEQLERGKEISPALLKAIGESRISIVVLSENYASSTWCLDELTKILECKEKKQQIVVPVFYKVDPSIVRNQKENYGEALANYKDKLNDHTKVDGWKSALKEVANLSGFHLKKDGNESEFIHSIIRLVDSKIINHTCFEVANHPIGVASRVHRVYSLLSIGKNDIVHMVGIFGVGGIGKTTIAKAVYNVISSEFQGSCFLKNIRETASKSEYGLVQLQKTLLSNILGEPSVHDIGHIDRGINVIKNRLRSKRVLLILDDVNEWGQLKALAGNRDWFGLGSIIIITTRDRNLLSKHEVDATYEVEELNNDEALKLFSLCAFKREEPLDDYLELSERIIRYAGGLPLALEVLGLDLRGSSINEWESALEEYKRIPHEKIQKILRMSYDGLLESEKNIFLDIACFFKGENVDYVVKILDSCGLSPKIGIKKLMDKCLITIDACNKFEMHDLLQDMGREIVREESPKEPGERSRLWYHEDIRHVLEENTGTNQIEGILIDLTKEDLICLSSEAFMKMKNLRYFINCNARLSEAPSYLSNELRVLIWNRYPSQSLPYTFHGKKLVDLRITCSLFKELGVGLQNFQNLARMDLSFCEFLEKVPDLSRIPNLEWLDFSNCTNLVEVHASVGSLNKLEHLSFARCTKLTSLPTILKFRCLKFLAVEGCLRLQNFPEIVFERECLRNLSLAYTDIKELPLSIGHLTGLEELDLCGCKNVVHLPTGVLRFRHLNTLALDGCSKLVFIPNILKDDCCSIDLPALECLDLENCHLPDPDILISFNRYFTLQRLNLSGSDVIRLPESLNKFDELRTLELMNCKKLQEIRALPPKIEVVDTTGCMSLERFPDVLKILHFFESPPLDQRWTKLAQNSNEVTNKIEGIKRTASQAALIPCQKIIVNIFNMRYSLVKELGDGFKPKNLTIMKFFDCNFLEKIPDLSSTPNLKELIERNCRRLEVTKLSLLYCEKLEDLLGCKSLERFSEVSKILEFNGSHIRSLGEIRLYGCKKMHVNIWNDKVQNPLLWKGVRAYDANLFPKNRIPEWRSYVPELLKDNDEGLDDDDEGLDDDYYDEYDDDDDDDDNYGLDDDDGRRRGKYEWEIDIEGPHYLEEISGILLYAVMFFKDASGHFRCNAKITSNGSNVMCRSEGVHLLDINQYRKVNMPGYAIWVGYSNLQSFELKVLDNLRVQFDFHSRDPGMVPFYKSWRAKVVYKNERRANKKSKMDEESKSPVFL